MVDDYGKNALQSGDVLLYQNEDGVAEFDETDGIIQMTRGVETMAHLVLRGGNEKDDGSERTKNLSWWGNEGEPEERQLRGRFNGLCASGKPLTSQTLVEFREAATEDLETAFVKGGVATSVTVQATIPMPKFLKLSIMIVMVDGTEVSLEVTREFR